MKKKLLCAGLLCVAPLSLANKLDELNKCVTLDNHQHRLACYDRTMRSNDTHDDAPVVASKIAPPVHVEARGDWKLVETRDANNKLILSASIKVDRALSASPKNVRLQIRCHQQQGATLSVNWSTYLGRDAYVSAGEEGRPGKRLNWKLDVKGNSTTYPGNTATLIDDLYHMDHFVVQTKAVGGALLVASFDMQDLQSNLQPYQQLCAL